jgi:hypothetical protein
MEVKKSIRLMELERYQEITEMVRLLSKLNSLIGQPISLLTIPSSSRASYSFLSFTGVSLSFKRLDLTIEEKLENLKTISNHAISFRRFYLSSKRTYLDGVILPASGSRLTTN